MRPATDTCTKEKNINTHDTIWLRAGRLLLLLSAVLLFFSGCNQSPRCLEETDVFLHARFLTLDDGQDRDTILAEVQVYGIGREDSLLVDGDVSRLTLPLDAHYDSCAFVIAHDTLRDTLTFRYSRSTRLLSFECGFIAEFDNLKVRYSKHFLDSLAVVNDFVTNTDDENIKIYLFRH